ncbi:hypothetical protein CHS0354_040166 [Potamilus streckersoni]|uniref:TIR domain-containing protein n=1 Tax=Potamilus streckersoni TaxID=2493646 RepID=A0AAE0STR6_9BIVA|nr:hypothetical protein CHS0354_040166 [Potamilus streckersoni]
MERATFELLSIVILSLIHSHLGCNVTRNAVLLGDLFLEYTSVDGTTYALTSNNNFQSEEYLRLVHKNGVMGYLPTNICKFPNMIKIDLSQNRIRLVGNISCLVNLEELNLKKNSLTNIYNKTFSQLKKLMFLDISENRIKYLDPFSLAAPTLNIQYLNASCNELTSLDITNIVMSGPFCTRDFSHNQMTELTNVLDLLLNVSVTYGPGMVYMSNNPFQKWPDFRKLGVQNLTMLGTLLKFGFDFRGTNFSCDCEMVPFLEIAVEVIKDIWRDYFEVKCTSPPNLMGKPIIALVKNGSLDQFVCTKDVEEGCPVECTCVEQPSKSRLVVDCEGKGLIELPKHLPNTSLAYELNVCDNEITILDTRCYLEKVAIMNASNNSFKRVEDEAIKRLNNYLPSQSMDLRNIVLFCDCNNLWVSDWLDVRHISSDSIFCNTENHGRVEAIYLKDLLLHECQRLNLTNAIICISLATAIILFGLPSFLLYHFKYELRILFRRHDPSIWEYDYDIYLSSDEGNDTVCVWIRQVLLPYLQNFGYRIYLPMRDCLPGQIAEDEARDILRKTRCFLVILSESYLRQEGRPRTEIEWKYAWDMYLKDRHRKIVMINFDYLPTNLVQQRQIKAFVRVGKALDFGNRDGRHLENVQRAIGSGSNRSIYLKNTKPWFNIGILKSRNKVNFEPQKSMA